MIPEVDAGEVTVEHLRSAVWNDGSLIVRGLIGPERVTQLVDDIDAALEAHESQLEGIASEEASRVKLALRGRAMSNVELKRFRGAAITRGSVLTAELPRSSSI